MKSTENTKKLLLCHFEDYPRLQIRDIFKFIYQSAFGCEHMISDVSRASEMIRREYDGTPDGRADMTVPLDGDFCRVDLSILDSGLTAETLGKLFYASSKCCAEGLPKLLRMPEAANELILCGKLPFSHSEFTSAVTEWAAQGYPAVHHSDVFRKAYKPAYRVLSKRFVPYVPLLARLDEMLEKGSVILAVEGGSAVGKTTLSRALEDIYGCSVFHMDDFFLRPEQRTPERFAEPGGNVDRERFLEEILLPLSKGEDVITYRPFDCSVFDLGKPVTVCPERLCVIEGAYSMHPDLEGFYDVSVFIDLPAKERRSRILKRNPDMADRFFNEWMPMEDRYFREMNVKERCTLKIDL